MPVQYRGRAGCLKVKCIMCARSSIYCVFNQYISHFCSNANKVNTSFHLSQSWLFFWVHWPAVRDTFIVFFGGGAG